METSDSSTPGSSNAPQQTGNEQMFISVVTSAGSKGVTDADLEKAFPNLTAEMRVTILNKLIAKGFIDLFNSGGNLVYKIKDNSQIVEKLKGADNEEKVVFKIIEEAGNKGIWIRDIRFKSNLMPTQLNKILKLLEGKKMIKAVKSVAASKKKVYMLFNLEPDRTLTGGAWYCDQDFETEFVDVLNQQCYRFLQAKKEKTITNKGGPLAIRNASYASAKDVWKFITELGISKVQLSEDDIKTILDTLVFDGKLERIVSPDGGYLFRAIDSLLPPPDLVRMPCGVCPVINNCSIPGKVNPEVCVYLNDWMS
ncbi:LOW QUALITY PROTEIN: probable DNA-directed RNA polymerase III subunit RPC6 [Nilaparvata lugens]|uniref:LOW QUALITY PROTEIN: probable DNA-directed RNA polymerase III subunit RPC6 n=1 Tax=Nilaparvata lugens TaxID=108931 RepID=UPI00193D6234|nr:LOW QUALITY PROTEIN: probable DNA-directed RNA polymerase III subunit RPC6 [Nilaparvata lugens]